jgi:hypothetical protein
MRGKARWVCGRQEERDSSRSRTFQVVGACPVGSSFSPSVGGFV